MMRALFRGLLLSLALCVPVAAQTIFAQSISLPLAIASGGTFCVTASGTCLDNITGFSSTGILERTGGGTYTFLADPLTVAHGGTSAGTLTGAVIGHGTSTMTAVAEVDGDCLVGAAGAWGAGSCSGSGGNATIITAYTTSCTTGSPCTWTQNAATKMVHVFGCGGGGGGANGPTSSTSNGGGAAWCSDTWFTSTEAGSSQTLSVGAGGAATTTGGPTCFGGGGTCGTTIASANLLYFGGGQGCNACGSGGNQGSPFGTSVTTAPTGTVSTTVQPLFAGNGSSFANVNNIPFGAGGGGSGGSAAGGNGGAGGFAPACNVYNLGGTGVVGSGSGGPGITPTIKSSGTYLPGCGGSGGGGSTLGIAGTGGSGVNGGGGGAGGGSSGGTIGAGGSGGNGFLLIVESP